ncbi:MAG: hypothetical protein K6G45_04030, partial [Lachnospiraceae bacterium]|nr:hypothetical protein [Lachnospiraceae bacterium]
LTDIHTVSQYKAFDGKIHGEERDVTKRWKQGVVNIAVLGIENQSEISGSLRISFPKNGGIRTIFRTIPQRFCMWMKC